MKIVILLSVSAVVLGYTDVEPIDVDAVVQNPKEIKKFMDCFLDKGPCTPVATHVKGHLLEAIKNACKSCTSDQKHKSEEFMFNVLLKYPEYIDQLKKKYDPEGKYFNKYILELSKY